MEDPNSLYLSPSEDVPDDLFDTFKALPGRLAVAMYQTRERGGILMPDSGRLSADVGVVISDESPVVPGQEVLVTPDSGMWLENFRGSGMRVKLIGVSEPWYESIPAMRQGEFLIPLYDWVLLERKPFVSSVQTLTKWMKWEARVIAIGPQVKEARPETDVVFKQPQRALTVRFGGSESWLLVREKDLLAVIDNVA